MWDAVIPELAEHYLCLRFDKRGHISSPIPIGPYTIEQFSADLNQLLDSLMIHPHVMIGISVGGLIAMDYALRYGGNLDGLVLADTAAQIGTPDGWQQRINALNDHGLPDMAPEILPRWFAAGFAASQPANYRQYLKMLAQQSVAGYAASCAALRDADLRDRISGINLPTMVLCGDEDLVTPPELCADLAASLPNARFATIADAGHLPPIEQPAEFVRQLRDFVGALT